MPVPFTGRYYICFNYKPVTHRDDVMLDAAGLPPTWRLDWRLYNSYSTSHWHYSDVIMSAIASQLTIGLVPSGSKPLPGPKLTRYMSSYRVTAGNNDLTVQTTGSKDIHDLKFALIMPTDAPSSNGARSSAGTMLTTSWWCHQMETFFASLALCAGNSPVIGEFPPQRPVTRSFDVFFHLPEQAVE